MNVKHWSIHFSHFWRHRAMYLLTWTKLQSRLRMVNMLNSYSFFLKSTFSWVSSATLSFNVAASSSMVSLSRSFFLSVCARKGEKKNNTLKFMFINPSSQEHVTEKRSPCCSFIGKHHASEFSVTILYIFNMAGPRIEPGTSHTRGDDLPLCYQKALEVTTLVVLVITLSFKLPQS